MPTRRSTFGRTVCLVAAAALAAGCGGAEDILGDQATATSPSARTPVSPQPSTPESTPAPTPGDGSRPDGFGPGPAGAGLTRFYQQDVQWQTCDGGECADIWVPLDYRDPDGQAITVKAKRNPADDSSARLGSMLINPGGPGGSGIDYLGYAGFDSSITDVYDVVGFDPRGVARSTPVDCLSDDALDAYVASDPTPDDEAEIEQFQEDWAGFTRGCTENSGPLLGHVSTVEVARDMDVLRAVLGDKKLTYFGASYGTFIGATYAALFPGKVARMVLDGAVDPLQDPRQRFIDQAVGFETALTAYLQYCVDEGGCPLGDDVDAGRERLIQLFQDLDANPLPTRDGRVLTEGLAFLGVIVPLYDRGSWDYETLALRAALSGSGDLLLLLSDAYTHRQPDGGYTNNSVEVQSAVNCLDSPQSASLAEIKKGAAQFVKRSPVFGRAAQWWPYACSNWPLTAAEPPPDYSAKGAAPIVVVGTTRDPATPYESSVRLAAELDSGVLLSRDGDGHTAYGAGNACIDDAINTYLVTGDPPADGTEC